jgi:nucleotide-binding universal stress UspA family protein
MKHIVVGVDESPYAQAALRWAVAQADPGQNVTAVMAWGYLDQHGLERDETFDAHYTADRAAEVVDGIVARVLGPEHEVTSTAICDLPARALLEAAEDAALLVVGARGVGGFRGLLLGSVSKKVLRGATCPVAVVRDDAIRFGEPMVVGIDGSGPSQRALEWAVERARVRQRRLIALHAWEPAHVIESLAPHRDHVELEERANRFLDQQLSDIDTTGLIAPIERRAVGARPAAALLEASSLASMVIVGSRGRGQLTGALFGSVSDQVSHHATCPVIVVP